MLLNFVRRKANFYNNVLPLMGELRNIKIPIHLYGSSSFNGFYKSDSYGLELFPLILSNKGINLPFLVRKMFCNELRIHDVDSPVEIYGKILNQCLRKFYIFQDDTGVIKLVPDDRFDVQRMRNAPLNSFLSPKGFVTMRLDKSGKMKIGADNFEVFIDKLVSVNPRREKHKVENAKNEILVESLEVMKPCGSAHPVPFGEGGENGNSGDSGRKGKEKSVILQDEETIEQVIPNPNKYTDRTHTCGELNTTHINQNVHLMGWVESTRMNKFIILRDRFGRTQLYIPESNSNLRSTLENLNLESVISVEGTVCRRPSGQENLKLNTGEIEVSVTYLKVLNEARHLPFQIKESILPKENVRMKYRYLDFRFANMQYNLRTRCQILHKMRRFLIEHLDFVEVETPTLFKRTPGGSQEFVVPTRNPNKFYSLVQSPQQFKQLLMVGSVDRYFQIARCYRDEDARTDRQPEFTQLDIEMSFCDRESVFNLIEQLLIYCWPKNLPPLITPFPRLTYEDAMSLFGSEKPDLRFDWKLINFSDFFVEKKNICTGKINLELILNKDFAAYAFVGRQGNLKLANKIKESIKDQIKEEFGDVKFFFIPIKTLKYAQERLESLFCLEIAHDIEKNANYEAENVLFLALGPKISVLEALGKARVEYANYLQENKVNVRENNIFKFVWVLDFPLFKKSAEGTESNHHPFTLPHPDDAHLLENNPLKARSLHYDLVLNGSEVGGGSIRIHDGDVQKMVLEKILNIDTEPISYLIEALNSGAPPHGGIALGLDRLLSIICGTQTIRDVIAFPKGSFGQDIMAKAPSDISEEDKRRFCLK